MKKLLTVMCCAVALSNLVACNTVRGIGQDIEKGGEAIQKATK